MSEWKSYYETTKNQGPHKLLVKALVFVRNRKRALDLGAGAGRDTRYLISQGFSVDAVDASPEAAEYLPKEANVVVSSFDSFDYPESAYDLVSAQFSLPFNAPDSLPSVIERVRRSLAPRGIFVGQFFGPSDDWANDASMSFHTLQDAQELLKGMTIHVLAEEQKDGTTASGAPKHWHVIDFIAENAPLSGKIAR